MPLTQTVLMKCLACTTKLKVFFLQALSEADAISWPTHLRSFSSPEEYKLVKRTYQQLQHSGYYWGPLTMEEAHTMLKSAPLGTFLIRYFTSFIHFPS